MKRKLFAEWVGTLILLAVVVGSGIMAERLSGGNVAIALLGSVYPLVRAQDERRLGSPW